ncbi:DUF6879 family protein [Kutzneria sp. CA-103260]|uniref:DUF6879 family protein n=1 Tax=Kutzneria sp. CA-103260 TaxID=2802641 RepID=UPI001BAB8532|nr:DUF6879 family protein [Kutzneria sp. CA-103260]QUQ68251.1 hypothetical protein JJ691_59960 [Kutzneria sp. CA-103260]
MGRQLSVADFDAIYDTFEVSVWRWESQPVYDEPDEREPFERWRAGGQDDLSWLQGWLDLVRSATAAGREFRRVRRVTDTPSDYQRWLATAVRANIEAGEEVRTLREDQVPKLGLPSYDFLLVDNRSVAKMQFDDGRFLGATLHEDTGTVDRHRAWLAAAWQHASPIDAIRGVRERR